MKSGSLATKLITGLLALGVLAYFAFQIYGYFDDPLTTAVAYAYRVEEAVTVTGYLVRDEAVLPGATGGIPVPQRAEGERVGAGQTVAVVYRDEAAQAQQAEIEAVENQLEQLRYAQEAAANTQVSLKLDSSIAAAIRGLHADLAADKLSSAEERVTELRALVSKRDYTYRDSGDLGGQIRDVTARLKALRAAASSGATAVKAPRAGVYSAVVDGFEAVLTPERLEELTPAQFDAIAADGGVASNLGKLVYGDTWYFVTALDSETAEAFPEGGSTTLRFAKGLDEDLSVQVDRLGSEENGRRLVVFSGRKYLGQLTQMRRQSVDVIRSTYSGLRAPQSALRVVTRTVTDEDGVEREEQVTGVYCRMGILARFKPVSVVFTGDGFCLLETTVQEETSERRLRPGDQVIITAEDLYDGKVVA